MKTLKMKPNKYSGFLITFCGLDGCGKTTMINRLHNDLTQEYNVFITKQPTDLVRQAAVFRTYMDCPDHDAYDYRYLSLLAAGDRVQHSNKIIEPLLEKGQIVLSDRYFYSCLANLRARGYTKDKWIYEVSKSIIKPDIAFFFDIPVNIAVSRVRSRADERDRYLDLELQYRLREEYTNICKKSNGILISTEQSEDICYLTVKRTIERMLKNGHKK